MKTTSSICRGRVRAVEDAVETWKAEHDDQLEIREIEAIVKECTGIRELLQTWQKEAWSLLWKNQLANTQHTGELLQTAYARCLTVFVKVRGCIQWAKRSGYADNREVEFEEVMAEIQRLSQELTMRWPFIDPKQIEQSRAEIKHGAFQNAEGILRELQGPGCRSCES